jgi:hypothetical protein
MLNKLFSGNIQLIRLLDVPRNTNLGDPKRCRSSSSNNFKSYVNKRPLTSVNIPNRKRFYSVCFLEKNNFFGISETSPKPTEWFIACGDNVNVIRINMETLMDIHQHSCFLISQLNEHYKLAVPSTRQCTEMLKEKKRAEFYAQKYYLPKY